ncbi:MAG: DUF1003 domain-containing protein [Flavobacteriales bacterium]|nr:DUF1003 domain-containing protein [Flavobacteriales bacterium]
MEKKSGQCSISGKFYPLDQLIPGKDIRNSIFEIIKSDHPNFTDESLISLDLLNEYRRKYLEKLVRDEVGEISHLERDVLENINNDEIISKNLDDEIKGDLSISQILADKIASFGGSWTFIIFFFSFLFAWMLINIFVFVQKPFDPYPFILLNLILSCLAAIQAPIIMMSQNRKEEKDRMRSIHDYKVNLKAELEIRMLHEKVDHLLATQNQRLLEIQQIQADFMEDIMKRMNK